MGKENHRLANGLLRYGALLVGNLPGGRKSPNPRSVLVVRLGNVGDIVVALPAFQAIRELYPSSHLTLLTSPTRRGAPGAEEILAEDSTFDEMVVYFEDESSRPGFLRGLRHRLTALEIDLAVVLPGDRARFASHAKYLALLATCGVRKVVGNQLVKGEEHETGQVDRLMKVVEPLGPVAVSPFPWIRVSPADNDYAEQMLADWDGYPIVGMQCGAKRQANRWPDERFSELGRRLVQEQQVRLVLTGSPGEKDLTASIAARIGPECIDLGGRTTLTQLAAVAGRCVAFVSNDTGTMHVAAAMGTPVVAIFSGRYVPYRWHPFGNAHCVIRKEIECSPCLKDVCPLYPVPECLNRIEVTEVLAAVENVLSL